MNSICVPAVKEFLVRHKRVVAVFGVIVILGAALFGFKKMRAAGVVSQEVQEQWDSFNGELERYDRSIREAEEALRVQNDVVTAKQAYVDNSVYMKLDPEAVCVGNVQYAITVEEGVNAGYVLNALISYARDGGLMADVLALTGDEEVKYWQEVLTIQGSGANFSLTILQYSEEKSRYAISTIEKCVDAYTSKVKAEYGGFALDKVNETYGIRSDASVTNGQNTQRNDLRSVINTQADLEKKVVTLQLDKKNFMEKEQPVNDVRTPLKAFVKGFATVVVLGIVLLCLVIWFILYFDSIVRGVADVERLGCVVFGGYGKKNGYVPEAARVAMDVDLMTKARDRDSVYIADLGDETESADAVDKLKAALLEKGIKADTGHDPVMKAEELTKMVAAGQCVLFVRSGLTRSAKVREFNDVCKKYGVDVIGTIVMG